MVARDVWPLFRFLRYSRYKNTYFAIYALQNEGVKCCFPKNNDKLLCYFQNNAYLCNVKQKNNN